MYLLSHLIKKSRQNQSEDITGQIILIREPLTIVLQAYPGRHSGITILMLEKQGRYVNTFK